MDLNSLRTVNVRIDVLTRLAEQAMNDPSFRVAARDDLESALEANGYQLNADELALVSAFRESLAGAGVDLDLVKEIGEEELHHFLEQQGR